MEKKSFCRAKGPTTLRRRLSASKNENNMKYDQFTSWIRLMVSFYILYCPSSKIQTQIGPSGAKIITILYGKNSGEGKLCELLIWTTKKHKKWHLKPKKVLFSSYIRWCITWGQTDLNKGLCPPAIYTSMQTRVVAACSWCEVDFL